MNHFTFKWLARADRSQMDRISTTFQDVPDSCTWFSSKTIKAVLKYKKFNITCYESHKIKNVLQIFHNTSKKCLSFYPEIYFYTASFLLILYIQCYQPRKKEAPSNKSSRTLKESNIICTANRSCRKRESIR